MNSRAKGASGERELAHELEKYGFKTRRGQQFCGANGDADVVGVDGLHIECKRVERLNIHDAMRQALNDAREGDQNADFISCVAFGKAGEFAEKYLHQGTKMVVTGRIQTGSYTNKDGQKVYTTDVVIEEQEFAESKRAESADQPAQNDTSDEGFVNVPDELKDDLPFKNK